MPSETKTLKVSHKEGCPAERVEQYSSSAPDRSRVRVAHCVDCGAHATQKEKS